MTRLFVLLVAARVLGELFRARRQPAVVGELLAGVLLGPTLLGVLAPHPAVDTINALGILFLMAIAGMELDLATLSTHRRAALATGIGGLVVPFASGVVLALCLPAAHLAGGARRELVAVCLGIAMSISAIPVIARILIDLDLIRTVVGQVVLSAAVLDDLVGWMAFGALLAVARGGELDAPALALRVFAVIAFAVACLTIGRQAMRGLLTRFPVLALTISVAAAIGCAAIAEALGVHGVFGAFMAGAMIGGSAAAESARRSLGEVVMGFFAPVFFASVALKVDMGANFHPGLVAILIAVACASKIAGCSAGAALGGMPPRDALAVGVGMNARGAMEIVLAVLALEAGLIGPPIFTALIAVAIVTSMMGGPLLLMLTSPSPRPSSDRPATPR